jgi:hypothetical protein
MQMAAALESVISISEAPPVDHVLRARVPDDTRIDLLRALLSALGQPRRGAERHLFVKFDAWHVVDLEFVQRAFPNVPCIFLYREPAAVVASQQRMPGLHMVPGVLNPGLVGFDLPGILNLSPEEYAGRVLGAFYAAAAQCAESRHVKLLNYAQLPNAGVSQVMAWCGLDDSETRTRLERVAQFDAKTPSLFFDAADKAVRPDPSPRAVEIAARFVDPFYEKLEAQRSGQ